ncbi:MAG: hypothetical protein WAW17_14560 [Rhodococcus sp. (in: high G+C Gram-positive bacteria)]|uniref:hypothetical protein n=1 Tax=Rhodococcus sp. TaxID=1831 RepID=UPI003BB10E18
MNIVDGTGFQSEFHQSPTLANYSRGNDGRVSRILGHVPRLSVTDGDNVTVYDFDTITVDGGTLHAFGSGTVYATGTATVHAHDVVRVLAFDTATGIGYGHAAITCSDKATGIGYERSRLTLRDFSTGTLRDFSVGSFHNFTQGTIYDQGNGYAYDMAVIEIHGDHTSLRARGTARADVHDTPSVWLSGAATAHTSAETRIKFIVATEKACIITEPMTRPDDVELTLSVKPTLGYQNGGSPDEDRATLQPDLPPAPAELTPVAAPIAGFEPTPEPEPTGKDTTPTAEPAAPTSATSSMSGIALADFGPKWHPLQSSI